MEATVGQNWNAKPYDYKVNVSGVDLRLVLDLDVHSVSSQSFSRTWVAEVELARVPKTQPIGSSYMADPSHHSSQKLFANS